MANVYTRNGFNVKPYSEELFSNELRAAFSSMTDKKPNWHLDKDELFNIVTKQGDPCAHFQFINNGCYKETYILNHCPNYVVKFCSQSNDTAAEKALLKAATIENLSCAFLPTYFVNFFGFTCDMPVLVEEYDECCAYESDYSGDSECPYATDLEIQPIIDMTVEDSIDSAFWDIEDAYADVTPTDPAIDPNTKQPIPYSIVRRLCINNKLWIEEFVRFYGIETLERLADFSEKYQLHDLHCNNLGYIKDKDNHFRPVILDWLSLSAKKISEKCSAI